MESLDQGHLHLLLEHRDRHVTAGIRTLVACTARTLAKSYSDSLLIRYTKPPHNTKIYQKYFYSLTVLVTP
jgi:hypothetical protein